MERVPEKITVRLDFSTRELLAHYLHRKINLTASKVIRRAVKRFIEEENAALYAEQQRVDSHIQEVETSTRATKAKAVQS